MEKEPMLPRPQEPRAPGPAQRKVILLIATILAGLGALVGALGIILAPSYTEKSFRGPDNPTEARVYGTIILVPCLIGVYTGIRSLRRPG
jgi:hypothetical protein